ILRELFAALGNDPFVIAECLARPALSQRLLTNWYAYDQKIHGELRQCVEAELQAHNTVEQMKQLSGKYSEIELVRSDNAEDQGNRRPQHAMKVNQREWDESVQRLATVFGGTNNRMARPSSSPTSRLSKAGSHAKDALTTQIKTGVVGAL